MKQFLLDVTRDSIFPDLSGAADEEDKTRTSQDNINGKGQFNSDDNHYEDNDNGSEEDKLGNDVMLTEADIFLSDAHDTLRKEEERMKTILESGGKLSTADVNGLKFMRQKLVPVYILAGINYSIMNDARGTATCFKCAMLYTAEELENMKVTNSITMDMERLNFQRLSVTACMHY